MNLGVSCEYWTNRYNTNEAFQFGSSYSLEPGSFHILCLGVFTLEHKLSCSMVAHTFQEMERAIWEGTKASLIILAELRAECQNHFSRHVSHSGRDPQEISYPFHFSSVQSLSPV